MYGENHGVTVKSLALLLMAMQSPNSEELVYTYVYDDKFENNVR